MNNTFDTFLGNQEAKAMCMTLSHNPLYICGNTGLGKTHLLYAILNNNPTSKVNYMTCEEFMDDYVKYLKNNELQAFNEKYNDIDILLIDNLDDLSGREKTLEAFLQFVEKRVHQHKQIVMTSTQPLFTPTITLQPLSKEDIETIIHQNLTTPITNEVLTYIINHYSNDIRSLKGLINRLNFYQTITKKTQITIEDITK